MIDTPKKLMSSEELKQRLSDARTGLSVSAMEIKDGYPSRRFLETQRAEMLRDCEAAVYWEDKAQSLKEGVDQRDEAYDQLLKEHEEVLSEISKEEEEAIRRAERAEQALKCIDGAAMTWATHRATAGKDPSIMDNEWWEDLDEELHLAVFAAIDESQGRDPDKEPGDE